MPVKNTIFKIVINDMIEFCRKLESGRKACEKFDKIQQEITAFLEENFPDIDFQDVLSKAENADTISDAISCYMQYGEYSPEEIWDEIKETKGVN